MIRYLKFTLASFFLITVLTGCPTDETSEEIPVCIKNKIAEILTTEVTNPPTKIWKWEVDAKTYFYITSDCCDQYNYLYTNKCELVCAPDGGFTGNGDGNCPSFKGEIKKTMVWEDSRK
ncbi:hypothetical protein [Lutibacter sp.]|uniref:DUF6970 domain-containing protein n=1 Tax=Lutibacter sp. TaxID=1925666 RepID=UPI001A349496|nr:hypothetical protein [Lutibacter sp.]MBI9041575.1 hypothetical protein [Lutibacter sp.]